MTEEKISFYLQKNNELFNGDVLTVCYSSDEDEMKKYGLTSPNILLFIRSNTMNFTKDDCDFYSEISKMFQNEKIILRIQSECLLGMYGDSHCDCESQRINSIKIISQNGGIFVHLPQEAQGWGLFYKLKELELQVSGRMQSGEYIGKKDRDSAQRILLNMHDFHDNRSYEIVAKILEKLSLSNHKFLVITDSDKKIKELNDVGIISSKYSDDIAAKINSDNISEYLIKI